MTHAIFSPYSVGAVATLSAITVLFACGSEVDGVGTNTEETPSSFNDDTTESGATPDAESQEENAAVCEESTCAATTLRPEQTPDGNVPIPCSVGVPSVPDGESYGGAVVSITLADGSEATIPFVEAEDECAAAQMGWYYAQSPMGVQVTLCPETCEDAELGLDVRFTCQPPPDTATCPLLGPPPSP